MRRFSKKVLASYIQDRLDYLMDKWSFNPNTGTIQLSNEDVDRAVAYGKREALMALAEEFELEEK